MLFVATALLAAATCPTERADYRLSADPSITARFHGVARSEDWPNGVALQVRFGKTSRSYWFIPWQGGTDGRTNMAWVREASAPIEGQAVRRDVEVFTTDSRYAIDAAVPMAGQPAPAHILLPDLGHLTWYGTPGDKRDSAPRAFFDFVACRTANALIAAPQIAFPAVP